MTATLGQVARNLLEAPLVLDKPVDRLGRSLWLYVRLLTASNHRGTICRHIGKLAEDLSVPEQQIDEWLKRLTEAGLIEIQSPAPFLVIKLGLWSDASSPSSEEPPESSTPDAAVQSEAPVRSDSYSNAIAAISYRGDGGQGEGEALLGEILSTLGESDAAQFRPVLGHYPPSAIRQALRRVATTPANQIRKSKTALFRYLLGKLT